MRPNLLIVDDEEGVREAFRMALQDDYELTFAGDAKAALRALRNRSFDLCLLDIMLPDGSGLDLLTQVKRRDRGIEVIMVTALQGVETALTAMKGQAQDYITKPFRIEDLMELIPKVLARKKNGAKAGNGAVDLEWKGGEGVGAKVLEAAHEGKPLWLSGEPGTGITAAAREYHQRGPKPMGPFVHLDCGSVAPQAMEAELFGLERKGQAGQLGKLEFAQAGTLYLEDAPRIPGEVQARLARVFAQPSPARPDVRLAASSGEDPIVLAEKGQLRREFFALFKGRRTLLTPLRKRKEEIPGMIERCLARLGQGPKVLQKDALEFLVRYPWPGNLAELEDCLRVMASSGEGEALGLEDIPIDLLIRQAEISPSQERARHLLKKVNRRFERKFIRRVLERTRGNQTQAAKTLGLHRNTLILKLKELRLEADYEKIVRKRREAGVGFRGL